MVVKSRVIGQKTAKKKKKKKNKNKEELKNEKWKVEISQSKKEGGVIKIYHTTCLYPIISFHRNPDNYRREKGRKEGKKGGSGGREDKWKNGIM